MRGAYLFLAASFSCALPQAALAARWSFGEVILDETPFASKRINDIAIGDIDGDARPDVWVSGRNGEDHQSAWYRNPGPPFANWQRETFLEGSWKYGDLGDLDGDGDLDIVAGFDDEEKVYWAENDGSPGDGGWTKHFIGVDGKPDQILTGDLDGDGGLEVVAVFKGGPIRVLSRPDDPKGPWPSVAFGDMPKKTSGASIGDVDNDGDLDVIFGHHWFENPLPGGNWQVPENWRSRIIDPDWPTEARSAVADIDGDGANDVVLTGEETGEGVAWYTADDPSADQPWRKTAINRVPYSKLHSVAVGDINDDGKADVMIAEMHTSKTSRVTVFEQGENAGDWLEHVVSNVGSHNAKLGDLNGDGRLDIVGKNFEGDKRPRVWLNHVDMTALSLDRWERLLIETDLPHKATFVRLGDLNGDGLIDIAAGAWWWLNPGTFDGAWQRRAIGGALNNVAVIDDLDRDGDLDVIGTDGAHRGDHFFWAENDGAGGFVIHPAGPKARGDFLQGAAIGALNGGDERDLVLSWHDGHRTVPPGGTQVFRVPSDPRQAWRWQQLDDYSNEEEIALDDIDRDGDVDVHLGDHWLENQRSGAFALRRGFELTKGEVDRLKLADLNGDDYADAVIGAEDARWLVWAEHPGGDGSGPWAEHVIAEDFKHMSLDVADLDQDGDIDVVSGDHGGGGKVAIYENLNKGVAWTRHIVDPGSATSDNRWIRWVMRLTGLVTPIDHHAGTQLADLDNDGDLDIVSIGWRHQTLVLYQNLARP